MMIQLLFFVRMFAVRDSHISTARERAIEIIEGIGSSIIIRSYISGICGSRKLGLYRAAFLYYSSKSEIQMKELKELQAQEQNEPQMGYCAQELQTRVHYTGKLPFSGNPYLDLAHHGFDLHSCDVRFLKKPNANGHTVTGVFNVSGKRHTAFGFTYEGLISFLLDILYRRRAYISERHEAKRETRKQRYGQP